MGDEKELNARRRACLDEELTHIRVGWWWGEPVVDAVTVVGTAAQLHGSVCTCCPRRVVA